MFFFTDTATTALYTLSLHDALPICGVSARRIARFDCDFHQGAAAGTRGTRRIEGLNHASAAPAALCEAFTPRSEEHTSELQSHVNLVCRLLLEKKNK